MATDLSSSKADKAFSVLKAASGLVPVAGVLATLVDEFIPSELNKRRDALLLKLEADFTALEGRINNEVLTKPYFISIFLQSFRSAMATEQEEKVDSYRAIILNSLVSQNPNIDEIQMMIKITDSLTPLHIKLLKVFRNPREYLEIDQEAKARFGSVYMGGISHLTGACFPQYSPELIKVALKDLTNMGLGNGMESGVTMSEDGILAERLTEFGKRYLNFITIQNQ
jgi:hypothetical protein